MSFVWSKDYHLFLIYKDPLAQKDLAASASYSRVLPSLSIQEHNSVKRPAERPPLPLSGGLPGPPLLSDQLALFASADGNPRHTDEPPAGTGVWGWWRKPWETHLNVLHALRAALDRGANPSVLLYNQYLRRLYQATLRDMYFEPALTTVKIPAKWRGYCPPSYRDLPHLCGAFFALEIDNTEINAARLQTLFTDSASFEYHEHSPPIAPPDGVLEACQRMIDAPPRRQYVRACEQTLLVLRSYRQQDQTARLLQNLDIDDQARLTSSISETSWDDLLPVLRTTGPHAWATIAKWPQCIAELGRKARTADSRITRLDFELFAKACESESMHELLLVPDGADRLNSLGAALLDWLTSPTERSARDAAAGVFSKAWQLGSDRYGLAPMPEGYFRYLPALEAIASAVKHEIGKKFYRDHLSHNVRAALLSAAFMSVVHGDLGGVNASAVGFFAGLFHDIALPLSTFPETVDQLADALREAHGGKTQRDAHGAKIAHAALVGPILQRRLLQKSLNYVALLASINDLLKTSRTESFQPWEDHAGVLSLTDPQILVEELLCLSSDEHALVSAGLLFDYGVRGTDTPDDFDSGVRTLLPRLMGPASTARGRELAAILQCMALHDRRPAAKHHGVTQPPKDTPKALSFDRFPLAVAVSVADELQEWGRTLGTLDEIGAVDGRIGFRPGQIEGEFTLSGNAHLFSTVPFSPFEYLFGKIRSLGKLTSGSDNAPFRVSLAVDGIAVFCLRLLAPARTCRINFDEPYQYMDFREWPTSVAPFQMTAASETEVMLGVSVGSTGKPRDILRVDVADRLLPVLRQKLESLPSLSRVGIEGRRIELRLSDGESIVLRLDDYRFGRLSKTTTPSDIFPRESEAAVVSCTLETIVPGEENLKRLLASSLHLRPHPHFLDFDWRFEEGTCRAIVDMAIRARPRRRARICYLGCPSLALWHATQFSSDTDWMLLDKGHFALKHWLEAESWIQPDRHLPYDVYAPVPEDVSHSFDIVLTDPPWYDPEYQLFMRRAVQLLVPGGILGITYYPPSLDPEKYERFQRFGFGETIRGFREFGALEIAYSPPEFETTQVAHERFQHPESGTYRAGFMDFFQAPDELSLPNEPFQPQPPEMTHFPLAVPMPDSHHLRCISNEAWDAIKRPVRVTFTRHGIERPRQIPDHWIAWSTRNTIAKLTTSSRAPVIDSPEHLAQAVAAIESAKRSVRQEPRQSGRPFTGPAATSGRPRRVIARSPRTAPSGRRRGA